MANVLDMESSHEHATSLMFHLLFRGLGIRRNVGRVEDLLPDARQSSEVAAQSDGWKGASWLNSNEQTKQLFTLVAESGPVLLLHRLQKYTFSNQPHWPMTGRRLSASEIHGFHIETVVFTARLFYRW